MANPPITIGPWTNVPAPGSPIRSDWAQSISTSVANDITRQRTDEQWGDFDVDIGSRTQGAYDVAILTPTARAYPCRVVVVATVQFGFGGAANSVAPDIMRSVDNLTRGLPGLPVAAGAYAVGTVMWSWPVGAGGNCGFKVRASINAAGNVYLRAFGTYQIRRNDSTF